VKVTKQVLIVLLLGSILMRLWNMEDVCWLSCCQQHNGKVSTSYS
jgi:hypothetical protein